MDLFESIYKRKSCRKFKMEAFTDDKLAEIKAAAESFNLLFQNAPLSFRFTTDVSGMFKVDAPHYLIISGSGNAGERENAGFVGQQLVLWLDAHGTGSVWLGKAKDLNKNADGQDLITIAFGEAVESLHRELAEFKRKPIDDVTNDVNDVCIQAMHLAPSGMNIQPWYFEKTADKIVMYEQILKPPISLAYKNTPIDMGIALCHCAVAYKHFDRPFAFNPNAAAPPKKGYRIFGEIEI